MGRIFAFIYGLAAYFIGTILYAVGFVAGRRALARDNRLQKERAQLHVHALPDHLLRDIGVSRCEIAGLRAVGPSGRRRHRRREAMHAEIKEGAATLSF